MVPTDGRPRPTARRPYVCATSVSIEATCSSLCPFFDGGCYGRGSLAGTWARNLDEAARECTADQVIAEEVRLIDAAFCRGVPQDGARGGRDLRLHVLGDIRTRDHARLLGAAATKWTARGGGRVWVPTHAWREVPRSDWGADISVMSSIERAEDVEAARQQGYASLIVVERLPSAKAFSLPGTTARIVPCPAQAAGRTCSSCRLCLDADKLLRRNVAIALEAHGPAARLVRKTLARLGPRESAGTSPVHHLQVHRHVVADDADGAAATSASSPPSMAGKISKSPPHNAPRPARLCDPAARCHVGERRNRA
jgi:hypothetical protein